MKIQMCKNKFNCKDKMNLKAKSQTFQIKLLKALIYSIKL